MTQPVQEPTTQRSLSRLTWGENQLFRRPAPPSAEISVFRAYMALNTISVSGLGTTASIFFDIWENCDSDVFSEITVGDHLTALDISLPGEVEICWGVKYSVDLDDSSAMGLIDDEPVFGANTYITVHGRDTNGVNSFEMVPAIFLQTFKRSYPTMDPFSSGNQFPVRFTFTAAQLSGATEDIEFCFLDVSWTPANICAGPIES